MRFLTFSCLFQRIYSKLEVGRNGLPAYFQRWKLVGSSFLPTLLFKVFACYSVFIFTFSDTYILNFHYYGYFELTASKWITSQNRFFRCFEKILSKKIITQFSLWTRFSLRTRINIFQFFLYFTSLLPIERQFSGIKRLSLIIRRFD